MTFSICFWTLLSQKDLSFVYLSPWLSKALGTEDDLLLGTSFFDYFHPEEQEMARHDLSELVKKKTLSCSVTRCQYNTIQTIRKKLQQSLVSSSKSSFKQMSSQYSPASSTMTSPNFTTTTSQVIQRSNDDEYMVMDVGMNVVSQDIVLACFHSDDVKQSNSNCVSSTCGETEFTKEEVNKLTSLMRKHLANKVQTPPSTPFPENFYNNETPNRIFQILDRKSRSLIFTWPDSNSNNYNKYDFSRLIWNSSSITRDSNIKKSNNLDVESPNCLRLLTIDKHMISTSGTYRQVESVIIPYGDIVFACFQMLPSATSTILGVTSAFTKPKARSAPCSPTATNNSNNIYVKRPRSPGSLSPLPSSFFYDDESKRYNNPNSSYCHHDVPEFILENHRSKRHRIDVSNNNSSNDQTLQHSAPIKISSSPQTPHLLLNPISPSYHEQQRCSQPQFSFSQNTTLKDHHHPQPPYFSNVTPSTSQPRQPSPKRDYPSPTLKQDYPSTNQFHNISINSCNNNNNNNNNNVTQPQQSPPPSSQSSSPNQSQQRYTQFTPQQRRNNNTNNNNNNVQGVKKCESCHTSSSPEWRRGPTGHKTLCNACGLRYSRTIARENRKREQAQREQEQRQREQREREERARERAAATVMMQRVIEPFHQYRSPNATTMPTMSTIPVIAPGQQHQQVHHQTTNSPHSSGSLQYLSSTLPPITPITPITPISYHRHHQPQPSHYHHHHNIRPTPLNNHHHHQHQIDLPPPSNNDRVSYTLPPPHFFDRQQNGTGGPTNGSNYQIPGSR